MIHLHVHSNHSLLASTISPEEVALQAKKHGQSAVALTDTNSIAGVIPFINACQKLGITPIVGAHLTQTNNPRLQVVILAKNRTGYHTICQLITRRQLNDTFRIKRELEQLKHNNKLDDIIIMTPCWSIAKAALASDIPIHMELTLDGGWREEQWYKHVAHIQKSGVPVVATGAVRLAEKRDYNLLRILRAIHNNCSPEELSPSQRLYATPEQRFKSGKEVQQHYAAYPNAISETHRLAAQCLIDLSQTNWEFPEYPHKNPQRLLNTLTINGLRERLLNERPRLKPDGKKAKQLKKEYITRLRYELRTIKQMGFTDYFLVVWDIVQYANAQSIPTIGRGSAANSLVGYALGITHVDPIEHNLYFERFLNPYRNSPPDIDLDFCWKRRKLILAYVVKKYGAKHVAMISTIVTMGLKLAFREVGRSMGLSEEELSKITKKLPHIRGKVPSLGILKEQYPSTRHLPLHIAPYNKIYMWSQALSAYPRHYSVHPGGMIITKAPITHFTAQQRSENGVIVTQNDMYSMDDLKLVKIDLLGNRSISVYCDAIAQIKENGHMPPPTEQIKKVFNDHKTQRLIRSGATIGCFYIESPAMRQLLKKLGTRTFEELTAASSVIRPGVSASGMMTEYIARARQEAPSAYLHPKMKEILGDTHGVMIYQEDCLKVAHKLAGMSVADADMMRRAISGKARSKNALAQFQSQFIRGATQNGVPENTAQKIWEQISSFAFYSFCKAHSASFAILSFQVAMLKTYHPAEFMAAVISNGGGFYSVGAYLSECRRMGLSIKLPCVNSSEVHYTGQGKTLQMGLMQIASVKRSTKVSIVNERKQNGPYSSLWDLLTRVRISKRDAEILILSGACNGFCCKQSELLTELSLRYSSVQNQANSDASTLFPMTNSPIQLPKLDDYSVQQKCLYELEHLGVMVSRHPLDILPEFAKSIRAKDLVRHAYKPIRIVGGCIAGKTIRSQKNQKQMKFMSMEDLSGTFEVTLFPSTYAKYASATYSYGPYIIEGRVDMQFGVPNVTANKIIPLKL